MAQWPSTRASRVLEALQRIGWREVRRTGSHRRLARGGQFYTFAFHDAEEIGPPMLARTARHTGLCPEDL